MSKLIEKPRLLVGIPTGLNNTIIFSEKPTLNFITELLETFTTNSNYL